MTEDVRKIKNIFMDITGSNILNMDKVVINTPTTSSEYCEGSIKFSSKNEGDLEVSFIQNKNEIKFSDGTEGKITLYPPYETTGIVTKSGYEFLYENKESAIKALKYFLMTGNMLEEHYCNKRKANSSAIENYAN